MIPEDKYNEYGNNIGDPILMNKYPNQIISEVSPHEYYN